MKVADLVVRDVITLHRDDPIDALMRALETEQDVFPVLDANDKVVGTVSEQDFIRILGGSQRTFSFGPRKLIREGLVHDVEDVMTPRPSTARPDESLQSAVRRMQTIDLPQLVVIDENDRFVGLIRARDIYRARFKV